MSFGTRGKELKYREREENEPRRGKEDNRMSIQ
jgi:hypothetical protein